MRVRVRDKERETKRESVCVLGLFWKTGWSSFLETMNELGA